MMPAPVLLRGNFGRLCCYLAGFLIILLTQACGSTASDKQTAESDSVATYHLPDPTPLPKAEAERIRSACENWYDSSLRSKGFNGGMIVAKDGNIIFEKYTGTAHIPGKDTITANTPLQIASISKTFTAMAVLKLVQDGKLQLDEEFSKYFPEFNYPGVTIRTLLDHRSGLPNYLYYMENMGWDKEKIVRNEDVLAYLVSCKSLFENIATPDQHFTYCNTNYALLALLIEKISGKKYPDYMQRTFFSPLQMKDTHVFSMADTNRFAPSYDWRGRLMPFGFLDGVYGDKNIYTTVRDLLTWDRALNSGLIFTPATMEEAYAPYSNEKPGIRNYGLGWRMNIYPDGKKIIYHNGWWHGSNATFTRIPEKGVAIIIIGNKFTRAVYHAKVLANLFGDYYGPEEEEEGETTKAADSTLLPYQANLLKQPGNANKDPISQKPGIGKTKAPVKKAKRRRGRR